MNRAFAFLAGVTAVGLASCSKPEAPTPPPPSVAATTVTQSDVPINRTWTGTTAGYQNADIEAKVSGYLMTQNYAEGSWVKQGTTLFTIDSRPYAASLALAKAQLGEAMAKQQLSAITLQRQTQLYKTKVISQQEYDTAFQSNQGDIASVLAAQANVQSAQLNLDYCTITAPFDGITGRAKAQIGDLVGAGGASTLTTMSMVDPIKVYFPLSEQEYLQAAPHLAELSKIPAAQRQAVVQMTLSNGSIYPEKGRFDYADRAVDQNTGTIMIAVVFPNPDNVMRPGQYAQASTDVETLKGALLVPQQAVMEIQGKYFVFVVNSDNTVTMQPVTPGDMYKTMWVITSGLKAGDKIIAEGEEKLRTGMKINPQAYTGPGSEAAAPATDTPKSQPASS